MSPLVLIIAVKSVLSASFSVSRLNQEFIKTIVWPLTQVAPRANLRGFVNDLAQRTEQIVLVSGEIHLERKAVGVVLDVCIPY